jgi:hypothetical protein
VLFFTVVPDLTGEVTLCCIPFFCFFSNTFFATSLGSKPDSINLQLHSVTQINTLLHFINLMEVAFIAWKQAT